MKMSRWIVAAALFLVGGGCRSGANQQLVERELRHQEDEIYTLQDELEQCQSDLLAARHENESLKHQLSTGRPAESPVNERRPRLFPRLNDRKDPTPDIEPPTVDPGEESSTTEPSAPRLRAPHGSEELAGPALIEGASQSNRTADPKPAKLVIKSNLTGGLRGQDDKNEGITVVFEPHNAGGKPIEARGEVSIVVLDRVRKGNAARVARWDFSADDAALNFKNSATEHGYHFDLAWPGEAPAGGKLHLYVRLTTPGGQKLTADAPLSTDPPDRQAKKLKSSAAQSRNSRPALRTAVQPLLHPSHDAAGSRPRILQHVRDRLSQGPDAQGPDTEASEDSAEDQPDTSARTGRPVWQPFR